MNELKNEQLKKVTTNLKKRNRVKADLKLAD